MPKQTTPNRRPGLVEMAPALTGVGTLFAGLAALLALVFSGGGGSNGSASPSPSDVATGSATAPATQATAAATAATAPDPTTMAASPAPAAPFFSRVLLQDDLRAAVPGLFTTSQGCASAFQDALVVTSSVTFANCMVDLGAAERSITRLADVRVQTTVTYQAYQTEDLDANVANYGGGDAGIMCRVNGLAADGDYYTADLTPLGWWQIYRYVDGKSEDSTGAAIPDLATPMGGARLLQLDCYGEPGGPTAVSLWVDGTLVGTYNDPQGLPAGSVALSVANYATEPAVASFTGLRVLGAGD